LSLIGLALAVAAVVLVFKRDFKEAVGVLAIGVIAVLLASPVGLSVLQNTVALLFGSG
jgi:FtsH-binding integral membrane protein